jgi:hypothetical protein
VAALAETFSGKPDKMRKYALLFLSSARDGLAEMDEALAMEDLAHLSELGHRTKSAARAVGAMQFGNLCWRWNRCATTPTPPTPPAGAGAARHAGRAGPAHRAGTAGIRSGLER